MGNDMTTIGIGIRASGGGQVEREMKRVVVGSRSMEQALRKTATANSHLATSFNKVWRSALYGVVGYGAVSAVRGVFSGIANSVKEVTDKRVDFERTMTPLLSLGNNINNISRLKKEALDLTLAFGKPGEGIGSTADFLYNLQSGSFNLPVSQVEEMKRETLELAQATGGELPTAMDLMLKTWQAYGSEIDSVNTMQNKLIFTQRAAYLNFQQMAENAPKLMGIAKNLGFDFNEVLSSIIAGSMTAPNAEILFTGLRSAMLAMIDAEEKGIKLTGGLVDKWRQLEKLDPKGLSKLFDKRMYATVVSIIDKLEDIPGYVKSIERLGPGEDIAQNIISKRMQNPAGLWAAEMEYARRMDENYALIREQMGRDDTGTDFMRRYEQNVAMQRIVLPGWAQFIAKPTAFFKTSFDQIPLGGDTSEITRKALAKRAASEGSPVGEKVLANIADQERLDKFTKAQEDLSYWIRQSKTQGTGLVGMEEMGRKDNIERLAESQKKYNEALADLIKNTNVLSTAAQWASATLRDVSNKEGKRVTVGDAKKAVSAAIDYAKTLGNRGPYPDTSTSKGGKGRIKGADDVWREWDPNKKSIGVQNALGAARKTGITGPNREWIPYRDQSEPVPKYKQMLERERGKTGSPTDQATGHDPAARSNPPPSPQMDSIVSLVKSANDFLALIAQNSKGRGQAKGGSANSWAANTQ